MGADDCGLSPMTGVQRCEEHEEKAPAAECLCTARSTAPMRNRRRRRRGALLWPWKNGFSGE